MNTDDDFLGELSEARVMAIIRGGTSDTVVAAALALFEEGMRFVEVSLTTPGACCAIESIRSAAPQGVRVGAGTVITDADVANVTAAGAQFVVTPALTESIPQAVRLGLPVVAGALTPTEAHNAMTMGAAVVKVFPASLGGPAYLRALRGPFPDLPLLAVGGVGLSEAREFLSAGAIGVGVGGPLLGDAVSGGELEALRARARAYVSLAQGSPGGHVSAPA